MALMLQYLPVVVLLILGFCVGTIVERSHFRRLSQREQQCRDIMVTDLRTPEARGKIETCGMVFGETVIASDYFKTFAAALRKLIGGELRMYETLMERARREALLRMVESAQSMGADQVINVRFATTNIGSIRRFGGAAMVEMYAYGTAFRTIQRQEG